MADRPRLGIGLIGSGFMGRTHTFGLATAERVFELPVQLDFHTLADVDRPTADRAASALGFAHASDDWRTLVNDPAIDVVHITAPNALHAEMALAAIAAGKHVYCEKPLAPTLEAAERMAQAATQAGVRTQVGFNYLCNPMLGLVRDLIRSGVLGEIRSYRGLHAEDYMADAGSPFTFRHDPVGGGVLADLGSHALATAEFLLGPIEQVFGDCVTVIGQRPVGPGQPAMRTVEVDDIARALVRFASGVSGSIEANWLATGRTMQHDVEIHGSRGSVVYTGERLNEVRLYTIDDPAGQRGFRRIEAGPDHAPYGRFCVAPGHQLGFNDLKAIEVARFIDCIATGAEEPFGFRAGVGIQRLVETIRASAAAGSWQRVA